MFHQRTAIDDISHKPGIFIITSIKCGTFDDKDKER